MSTDPKPRKQKQKESRSQSINGPERLKTIVRRLPPNLPEDVFWQSVQEWVTDDTVTCKSYHPGKLRTKRVGKEGIPSRAYIAFKNEALVATFSRAYDGHVFRDKSGNASQAVVEYAPFQKVPAEKKKVDARNNTIDRDDDYISFLEALTGSGNTESVSLEALLAASQPPPPPTTTPLLEALKAEKTAQRDKEAILRNHAHYKDGAGLAKKEDGKKKAAIAPGAAATATAHSAKQEPAVVGRKGRKGVAAAAMQKTQEKGSAVSAMPASPSGKQAAAATASLPAPASGGRHRPHKESHGRSHGTKGDAPASTSGTGTGPAIAPGPASSTASPQLGTTEASLSVSVGGSVPAAHGHRKNRPVIGLGRHFEAALSGAGVAVSQNSGDRRRREKGNGEGVAGGGSGHPHPNTGTEPSPANSKGKQKHREERTCVVEAVPNILQRFGESGPEVVIIQRPQSAEGAGPAPAPVLTPPSAGTGASPGRGSRRGRGRGRGVHRGG